MKAVTVPQAVDEPPNPELGLCVPGSDPAHSLASLAGGKGIEAALFHLGQANYRETGVSWRRFGAVRLGRDRGDHELPAQGARSGGSFEVLIGLYDAVDGESVTVAGNAGLP